MGVAKNRLNCLICQQSRYLYDLERIGDKLKCINTYRVALLVLVARVGDALLTERAKVVADAILDRAQLGRVERVRVEAARRTLVEEEALELGPHALVHGEFELALLGERLGARLQVEAGARFGVVAHRELGELVAEARVTVGAVRANLAR